MSRVWGFVVVAACANASPQVGDDDVPPGDGPAEARACDPGEFATDIPDGSITCAPITAPIGAAIDTGCSTFAGWRDSCTGCTLPPAKFGHAGAACSVGVGANNTCTAQDLGGASVNLLGINTDGDVNDDDKFYGTLHCAQVAASSAPAPCPAGQLIDGAGGSGFTCAPLATAVVDYIRTSCSLYLGWQDNCSACTTLPTKWGHAGDAGCLVGAGANSTCTTAVLEGETVNLLGLATDGDVNDDDKFHVGLDCLAAAPLESTTQTSCPAGQFVTATAPDGTLTCASVAPLVHDYFTQHCAVYLGWRDNCDGCTLVPAKWGQVKVGSCTLGVGLNDSCGKFTLGATAVDLFGLNTDGDVNDDDKFYMSLHCE